MNINTADGTLVFALGTIAPGQSHREFQGTPIGRASRQDLVDQQWRTFDVTPEQGVRATVFFRNDRLRKVFLSMSIPSDEARQWTIENELARKQRHDAWLRAELGEPPYTYPWGQVISDYDARGCVSEILVLYDN